MSDFSRSGRGGRFFIYFLVALGAFVFVIAALVVFTIKKGQKTPVVQVAPQVQEAPKDEPRPAPVQMVEVIVPVKNIAQSEPLQVSYFAKVARPANGLPQNFVRNYDELKGKYARVQLNALEPVSFSSITREQPVNPLADSIPIGFRAVAINVDARTGVEGWASPGAQVDVQWVTDIRGKKTAILLVQNAKVLSAERQMDPNAAVGMKPIPTTITLMVSERDAQKISLAAAYGTILLQLRGATDVKTSNAGTLTLNDIFDSNPEANKQIRGVGKYVGPNGKEVQIAIIGNDVMKKVD